MLAEVTIAVPQEYAAKIIEGNHDVVLLSLLKFDKSEEPGKILAYDRYEIPVDRVISWRGPYSDD